MRKPRDTSESRWLVSWLDLSQPLGTFWIWNAVELSLFGSSSAVRACGMVMQNTVRNEVDRTLKPYEQRAPSRSSFRSVYMFFQLGGIVLTTLSPKL